jgi:hypothetical protein
MRLSVKDCGQRGCRQPGMGHACTCAMGNVSRFIEPVVLRILKERKKSYGYEIAECLPRYALTDALSRARLSIARSELWRPTVTSPQRGTRGTVRLDATIP